jgi:CHAD domain-containing protein
MEAARHRIDDWPIADLGVGTWPDGFEATYRRARKAMAAAYDDPIPERFHEWRKAVKYHGYQVRLLRPMWDGQLRARGATADALSELLGAYHDVVVLGSTLHGSGTRTLRRLIDRRRAEIEVLTRPIGMRLFAERPRRIGARHARYWSAWGEEQRCHASGEDSRVVAPA